ncbi:hypothetical protein ACFL2U_00215 [Patescibacteria group bacterium]
MEEKELTGQDYKDIIRLWFDVNMHMLRIIRGHHNQIHPIFFIRRGMIRMLHRLIEANIKDAFRVTTEKYKIELPEMPKPKTGVDKML